MMNNFQRVPLCLTWIGIGVCALGCFSLAPGAQVRFTILDSATEQPLPCRIHLTDDKGNPAWPKDLHFWQDHFVCSGLAELELKPGCYTYEVDRGPEFLVYEKWWQGLKAGRETWVELAIAGGPKFTFTPVLPGPYGTAILDIGRASRRVAGQP